MLSCPAGLYCPDMGMAIYDGTDNLCRAGYYCTGGAKIPTPGNSFTAASSYTSSDPNNSEFVGTLCSEGNYCGEQSTSEVPCGAGSFINYEGASLQTECLSCPTGLYCPNGGVGDPSANICDAGYLCTAGSTTSNPTACLVDHYCVAGTLDMQRCDIGTFTRDTGQDSCETCTSGNYCYGQLAEIPCDAGYYCDTDIITPCPKGKVGSVTG